MDIGSILLILAILILVIIFISRPLINRGTVSRTTTEKDISALLAERDQIVASLQELDDDYNLGKIPPDIYPARRQALLMQGAEILRQIDSYKPGVDAGTAEDRLEAALVARRALSTSTPGQVKKNGTAVPPVPDDDLEQKIAVRRRQKEGKAGGFCPKCGKPILEGDRFCPRCGASLV